MAYRETERMRVRKAEVRQRILDHTLQIVSTSGFRDAHVTSIATAARVATGSIYRHFESKEALFAEVFRNAAQTELEKVADALSSDGPADVRLARSIHRFGRRAMRAPGLAWSLIAEPVDPALEAERLDYRHNFAALFRIAIEEGIREGSFPPQAAGPASTCVVGSIAQSLLKPLIETRDHSPLHTGDERLALINDIVSFCMRGLGSSRSDFRHTSRLLQMELSDA